MATWLQADATYGTISASVTAGSTSFTVASVQGTFPTPSTGQQFGVVINPNLSGLADNGTTERVIISSVTGTSPLTFTVAASGSLAHTHSVGEYVILVLTSAELNAFLQSGSNGSPFTITYTPQEPQTGGITLIANVQETIAPLPPVTGIVTNGTIWTISFASSILGTFGEVGDTFGCWTTGFTPSGYNVGNSLATVTATVVSATSISLPETSSPGAVTSTGQVNCNNIVSNNPNGGPRATVNTEGTVIFETSPSISSGIPLGLQNVIEYKNAASPYSASYTGSGAVMTITGNQMANVSVGLNVTGSGITAPGLTVTSVSYNGTNTLVTTSPNPPASGTATFAPFIFPAQGILDAVTTTGDGASVSFPTLGVGNGQPGDNQAWSLPYWSGRNYYGINGGTLSGINHIDYIGNMYLGASCSANIRTGLLINDARTQLTSGSGLSQGALTTQMGVVIAHWNPDTYTTQNVDPPYSASVGVGLLNAGTTFLPSQPPITTITTAVTDLNSLTGTQTLTVANTAGFPATGTLKIPSKSSNSPYALVAYTGIGSPTTFASCSLTSGPSGVLPAPVGIGVLGTVNELTLGAAFTLPAPVGTAIDLINSGAAIVSASVQVIANPPPLAAPYTDGQLLLLTNVGTTAGTPNLITFNSGGTTGLQLGHQVRRLSQGGTLLLKWNANLAVWTEVAYSPGLSGLTLDQQVVTPSPAASVFTVSADAVTVNPIVTGGGTWTITMPGSIASPAPVGGQLMTVLVYGYAGTATLAWTNTENSTVSVPTSLTSTQTANIPLVVQFVFNGKTTKWRCINSV